jgi:N-acetylmuramoyl-L-alanine amidase
MRAYPPGIIAAGGIALLLGGWLSPAMGQSGLVEVTNVRPGLHPTHTRLVFDVSRPVAYELQRSDDGRELRLTLFGAVLSAGAPTTVALRSPHLSTVQLAQAPASVHVTVQLKGSPTTQLFTMKAPHRIVLDLRTAPTAPPPPSATGAAATPPAPARLQKTASTAAKLIVIDPGHGGKDPGAIGKKGLEEKFVVLDIGHRLRRLLERQGYKVIMTRSDDTFIPLDDRAQLANTRQADLFISIHANASPRRSLKGVEIYLLGRATDADARAVAARENGTSESQLTDLEQIFSDMSLDYRINHSISLAHQTREAFLRTVGSNYRLVDLGVKRAPFYVLMSSTMPSILAEVSFISNPEEEARLKQKAYRQKVAEGLFEGIQRYLASSAVQS